MRRLHLGIALALCAFTAVASAGASLWLQEERTPATSAYGGPFTMTDTAGRAVSQADLLGRPTVLYFGYTYCPEVCPTTLLRLTTAMKQMGPAADALNVVFVSVDPGRDTPEQMKLYLSSFDPRIRGFTGTEAEVATIAKDYHVYYKREPGEGGNAYTMDHSSTVFLLDRAGRLAGTIDYEEAPRIALAKLTALAGPESDVRAMPDKGIGLASSPTTKPE